MSSREIINAAAGASGPATYVDDVFSTYLYTGNGSTQTITNGIDLADEGGLVWTKNRGAAVSSALVDTIRGGGSSVSSNTTNAATSGTYLSFNGSGYSIDTSSSNWNTSSGTYASWTFRKAPKFFDVVTYTGNGVSNRLISHSLGSEPGMLIVKRTDSTSNWAVWHRGNGGGTAGSGTAFALNLTNAANFNNNWGSVGTSTNFNTSNIDGGASWNTNGATYVAYLFAHNAGGFGAAGTDNVISCGSYTGTSASGNQINLGWEPQYVLIKRTDATTNWILIDTTRNFLTGVSVDVLNPNLSSANSSGQPVAYTATGFVLNTGNAEYNVSGGTYIYMAIRRPMKPPTSGTEVFARVARTGTGANATVSSGFVTDTVIQGNRGTVTAGDKFGVWNRLRGTGYNLTTTTAAEVAAGTTIIQDNPWDVMNGYKVGTTSTLTNASSNTFINWMFKRAPGFHDVVCYTGDDGASRQITHNLGVTPELLIIKSRSTTSTNWRVHSFLSNNIGRLNTTDGLNIDSGAGWFPTATKFNVTIQGSVVADRSNTSGQNYVALLFASLPGVSKVGSYTGNGSTQTINCGFTSGARFVLIKNTASGPNWFVWDTARGIVDGASPWLALNTLVPDNTPPLSVAPNSAGFIVQQSSAVNLNVNGSTYLYLAIA